MAKARKKVKTASEIKAKKLADLRKEPGMSNAGKYPNVTEFAGPNGTYPINTLKRAKSAIRLAGHAANPGNIIKNVLKEYPELKEEERTPLTYNSSPFPLKQQRSSPLSFDPRKKGKKYKTGDLIDETDHEEQVYSTTNKDKYSNKPGAGYNVEHISEIQEDEKGHYMTTVDESEHIVPSSFRKDPPRTKKKISNWGIGTNVTRDTLRPKKGKYFKQGWD